MRNPLLLPAEMGAPSEEKSIDVPSPMLAPLANAPYGTTVLLWRDAYLVACGSPLLLCSPSTEV